MERFVHKSLKTIYERKFLTLKTTDHIIDLPRMAYKKFSINTKSTAVNAYYSNIEKQIENVVGERHSIIVRVCMCIN